MKMFVVGSVVSSCSLPWITTIHVIGCDDKKNEPTGDFVTSFSTIQKSHGLEFDEIIHNTVIDENPTSTSSTDLEQELVDYFVTTIIDQFGSNQKMFHIEISVVEETYDIQILSTPVLDNIQPQSNVENIENNIFNKCDHCSDSILKPSSTSSESPSMSETGINQNDIMTDEIQTVSEFNTILSATVTEKNPQMKELTDPFTNTFLNIPVADGQSEPENVPAKVTPATPPPPPMTTTTKKPALPVDLVTPKRRQNPHLPIAHPTTMTPRPRPTAPTRRPRIVYNATITQFPDPDDRNALVWGLVVTVSISVFGFVFGIVCYFHYKRGRGHMTVRGNVRYDRSAGTLANTAAGARLEEGHVDIENLGPKSQTDVQDEDEDEEEETVFDQPRKDYESTRRRSPSPAATPAKLKKQETGGAFGGGFGVPEDAPQGAQSQYYLPGTIPPTGSSIQHGTYGKKDI